MLKRIIPFFTLFVVAFVLSACGTSTPEKTAEKFIAAVYGGDADTMMSLVYLPEEQKKPGMEEMAKGKLTQIAGQGKHKASEMGGVKKIAAEAAQYSDDKTRARVTVTVTFKKDNVEKTENVRLIQYNKEWKVNL